MKVSKEQIEKFLVQKNIVLVGVSRNPQDLTRGIYLEFKKRGYKVFPVNPYTKEIDGEICYPDVESIKEKIDAAIIFTPTLTIVNIAEDLVKKDVKNIWIHNSDGKSKILTDLVKNLKERGINIIQGYCPLMFLPDTQFFHRLHGFFVKLFGNYPS